jgi:hypothetical protein
VSIAAIKYDCAYDAEDDQVNLLLRTARYEKEREIVLNLAEEKNTEKQLQHHQ